MNIPSTEALDIAYNDFEAGEVVHCDRVKGHIEQNQSPFKEGVDRVCFEKLAGISLGIGLDIPPATLWTLCWIKK